jgi:stress-induced-phosphoprotein 1
MGLCSNRSGAHASLQQFNQALEDANMCISLNAGFPKGYSRKGLAQFNLGQFAEAKETYEKGLQIDGNNQQCKDGLQQIEQATRRT